MLTCCVEALRGRVRICDKTCTKSGKRAKEEELISGAVIRMSVMLCFREILT